MESVAGSRDHSGTVQMAGTGFGREWSVIRLRSFLGDSYGIVRSPDFMLWEAIEGVQAKESHGQIWF